MINPLIYADVPDMAVVRKDKVYYMISTSMHSLPGCPVMKSEDLVHWELVSYVFDRLDETAGTNLTDGKGIYGQGSWAVSFKYHNDKFYCAFSSNDRQMFYVYETDDIEQGRWTKRCFEGLRHDPAILFDDDKAYVLFGNGDIYIEEWESDLSAPKRNGMNRLFLSGDTEGIMLRAEGDHAYKINDNYYFIFIEWPKEGQRREICYRSKSLDGPFEKKVIFDENNGLDKRGIAQGEIFDTPDGKYYAMFFQDHGAVGRIPFLHRVIFEDGWPAVYLESGKEINLPEKGEISINSQYMLSGTDDFDYQDNVLNLKWQWNHHPDNSLWSVTERPGYLRLRTGALTDCVLSARNTLTQRTYGPACQAETKVDISGLGDGDYAGLVAMQGIFGAIGIRKNGENYYVQITTNDGEGKEKIVSQQQINAYTVYLKIDFNFEALKDEAVFSYSLDGENWKQDDFVLKMIFTLDHFMGYRAGLFNYATKETGGYADFDYFRFEIL